MISWGEGLRPSPSSTRLYKKANYPVYALYQTGAETINRSGSILGGFCTPGANRTHSLGFRRASLCPLSYWGIDDIIAWEANDQSGFFTATYHSKSIRYGLNKSVNIRVHTRLNHILTGSVFAMTREYYSPVVNPSTRKTVTGSWRPVRLTSGTRAPRTPRTWL